MTGAKLVFAVTNDLSYDQRMIRICSSLAAAGYQVELVGRMMKNSIALRQMPFRQKRLRCLFHQGALFYAEYNTRLFLYLLFCRTRLICAIDLDTILAVFAAAAMKRCYRVYDAHELFCEMKEVVTRPRVYRAWKRIERFTVPRFTHGYTVNEAIADAFADMYRVRYTVIRNIPPLVPLVIPARPERFVLYQGAINEGRSFETLIPAMALVNAQLVVCGEGNFMEQALALTRQYGLQNKIIFKGMLEPQHLKSVTSHAYIGITLFDSLGKSNYYSLANRFFDYMHAGVPQVCVDFPVYRSIVSSHPFALLIDELSPENIARHINLLLNDDSLYQRLQQECVAAREKLNWQQEEKLLLSFYRTIFDTHG